MPIRKVEGGWQWGEHGHVYPSRAGAERQAAAAHAHGYRGDTAAEPIKRDAFLYMEPRWPLQQFAQCATCAHFLQGRCALFWQTDPVTAGDSCGLYVHGPNATSGAPLGLLRPAEAGFVARAVRCENCAFFDAGVCGLYRQLNSALPQVFALDPQVNPKACCNAQTEAK